MGISAGSGEISVKASSSTSISLDSFKCLILYLGILVAIDLKACVTIETLETPFKKDLTVVPGSRSLLTFEAEETSADYWSAAVSLFKAEFVIEMFPSSIIEADCEVRNAENWFSPGVVKDIKGMGQSGG